MKAVAYSSASPAPRPLSTGRPKAQAQPEWGRRSQTRLEVGRGSDKKAVKTGVRPKRGRAARQSPEILTAGPLQWPPKDSRKRTAGRDWALARSVRETTKSPGATLPHFFGSTPANQPLSRKKLGRIGDTMMNLSRLPGWKLVLVFGLGLAAVALVCSGCSRPVAPPPTPSGPRTFPPWFADMTDEVGLDFVHDAGPLGSYFMPQIIGSGAALFDFNNDGLLDIYLLQNGGPQGAKNRLYQQLPDGHFKDVSAGSGLDVAGYNMGVAVGDVNNDGLPDVLLTQYGGLRLFLNNGDGTFTDVT